MKSRNHSQIGIIPFFSALMTHAPGRRGLKSRMKKAPKVKVIIGDLIRKTAGGRHGWYESNLEFPIRKPIQ